MLSVSDGFQAPTDRTDPDRPLVARIINGDEQALRELMDLRAPALRGWLALKRGYFFTSEDLDEIVSRTFLCFWRSAARFEARCTVKTYLGNIARNLMLNRVKYNQRFRPDRTAPIDAIHDTEAGQWTLADRLTDGTDLRAALETEHHAQDISTALARLDAGPRRILQLRCVDGRDYYQLAVIYGVAVGTIKSRLNRARAALRIELKATQSGSGSV